MKSTGCSQGVQWERFPDDALEARRISDRGRKDRRGQVTVREGIILRVEESETGIRLDRFLRERLPGLPSRSVRFAIEAGEVRVGGEKGRKGRFLSTGEEVVVGE